ncbi:DUF1934 domain-containing protein [Aerococcaceae bacterium DSM 111022]|nr:DUF1934 domain-containing protein [Aerococcaceae bacterium DSM 111022]
MQRKIGQLILDQKISYIAEDHVDTFHLEAESELIELKNYSRIAYQDEEENQVVLKWQQDGPDGPIYLEMRQPQYTMVFHPENNFKAHYPTPQGVWELEVETKALNIAQASSDQIKIEIDYQITMNEDPIANYQFRLIYQ